MSNNDAYLDYIAPQSSGGELNQLQELAEQQAKAEARMADLEAQMVKAKDVWKDLAERQIPELMDKIGMTEFKTTSGLTVEIAEKIRASIPVAKKPLAFAWLKRNGNDAMIKRTISIAFGMGEEEKANAFMEANSEYELADDAKVHPATLSAFVKDKLEKGEEIPLDLFGVYRERSSKIKQTKS